jgi:antitoxin FitA
MQGLDIISGVRQLLTRIDETLHERVRARAAAEGRSVNAVVAELLEAWVAEGDPRSALRARLAREGRLVVPEPPADVPTHEALRRANRGAGQAVSEALAAERER